MVNNAIIKKIVRKIKKEYQPEKILLFGSYAYGNPGKDSDIDLFIIKESNKRRIERFCEVRRIVRDIMGVSIQPVVFTRSEIEKRLQIGDDFIVEILKYGKVLHG
jgi:predicted nucleotidyltransferase